MRPVVLVSFTKNGLDPYVDRLSEVDLEPRVIRSAHDIPDDFDGLCLTGGPDVHPGRYRQVIAGANAGTIDPDRDHVELDELLPRALVRAKPVLGICRGIQVLNVYFRGTLKQDIGKDHHAIRDEVKPHAIRIDATSHLGRLLHGPLTVNSRHHQVIDELGAGLRAVAWADPYVEAVEDADGRWIVGVQWHPERVKDNIPGNGVGIFREFARAITERAPSA